MSQIKPLTPDEAAQQAELSIPDEVIQAVNNLLVKNVHNGYACIRQDDIVKEIARLNPTIQINFRWLNIENAYRKVGWKVYYDKPGYNESYPATFEFSKVKA
jgi:hypothetical protein